jgi:hypothetical protein
MVVMGNWTELLLNYPSTTPPTEQILIRCCKQRCMMSLVYVSSLSALAPPYLTSGNRTAMSPDCVIYRTHGNDWYWS